MNLDLKSQAQELTRIAAKDIEAGSSRKAIIIFVLVLQLKSFQKIQVGLVRKLEQNSVGSTLSLLLQGKFCLRQLEKAIQKISKSLPGPHPDSRAQCNPGGLVFPKWNCGQENPREMGWRPADSWSLIWVKPSRTMWNTRLKLFWCL